MRTVRRAGMEGGRSRFDFRSGPDRGSPRHSPVVVCPADCPVGRRLRFIPFRYRNGRIVRTEGRAQFSADRPDARRADRLCGASLRQSELPREDPSVPVPEAQRHALIRHTYEKRPGTRCVRAERVIVPCDSDPLAWIATGIARRAFDRSDTIHREPDRKMKFSSRASPRVAAAPIRSDGAARD